MDTCQETVMVVDAEVLVKVFVKFLNNEELINNKTYLAVLEELKKGDD